MTSRSPTRRRRLDHYGIAIADGQDVRLVIELLFNLPGFPSALRGREEPGGSCWYQKALVTGSASWLAASWSAPFTPGLAVWPRWMVPKS